MNFALISTETCTEPGGHMCTPVACAPRPQHAGSKVLLTKPHTHTHTHAHAHMHTHTQARTHTQPGKAEGLHRLLGLLSALLSQAATNAMMKHNSHSGWQLLCWLQQRPGPGCATEAHGGRRGAVLKSQTRNLLPADT